MSAHSFELAQHWRPSTTCIHPEHTQSTQKRKVSIPDRDITPDMAKEIMLMYGLHHIIGSRECYKYYRVINLICLYLFGADTLANVSCNVSRILVAPLRQVTGGVT